MVLIQNQVTKKKNIQNQNNATSLWTTKMNITVKIGLYLNQVNRTTTVLNPALLNTNTYLVMHLTRKVKDLAHLRRKNTAQNTNEKIAVQVILKVSIDLDEVGQDHQENIRVDGKTTVDLLVTQEALANQKSTLTAPADLQGDEVNTQKVPVDHQVLENIENIPVAQVVHQLIENTERIPAARVVHQLIENIENIPAARVVHLAVEST